MKAVPLALAFFVGSCLAQSKECGSDPAAPFCGDDETCCMDSPGCTGVCSECCLNRVSQCVLPRAGFKTSTCCPKWSIGCSSGSVGCCDPARPWAPSATTTPIKSVRTPNRLRASVSPTGQALVEDLPTTVAPTSGGKVAYALFTKALLGGLTAFTVDVATGATTHRPVKGPFDTYMKEYYGEGTRLLEWDPKSARFLLADVVLNAGKANASSPVVLYAINPADGSSTAQPVSGAVGYPIGLAWDATLDKLLLATQSDTTVMYFAVDTSTAVATPMGSLARGADEASSSSYYSAFISQADGGVAVRVVHQIVTKGTGLGVGTVTLSASAGDTAPAAAWSALDLGTHDLPATVHKAPAAADGTAPYVSLAPKKGGAKIEYDIISWTAGGAPTLVAALNNSHPPYTPVIHQALGYVGASRVGTSYGAMTVALHPNPILPGVLDKWTLSTVDLSAAEPATTLVEVALNPGPSFEGAETVALSGFGLAA